MREAGAVCRVDDAEVGRREVSVDDLLLGHLLVHPRALVPRHAVSAWARWKVVVVVSFALIERTTTATYFCQLLHTRTSSSPTPHM